MRQVLTDKFVRALGKAASGQRDEYWDVTVPGFGIRVTDMGSKSWVVYTRIGGVPRRRRIGDADKLGLAKARDKARDFIELVEQGVDPKVQAKAEAQEAHRRKKTTLGVVAEAWFADDLKRTRKAVEVERDVRREFKPWWSTPIGDITPLDVRNLIKAKAASAPAQARNLLGYASRLLGWAVDQHVYGITQNPARDVKPGKVIGKKVSRNRVLGDAELRALWKVAGGLKYPYGPCVRLLMLTGQRKSEVSEARWREFDLEKKLWTIPAARMKEEAAHVVPLSDDAVTLLKSLPRFRRGDHLFSTDFGVKPINGFSKCKVRLDKGMLAELDDEPEPWVIHDVRRSMRTNLSALVPTVVAELVISHQQKGIHKVYDQYAYLDEKRRALDLWAARLAGIVEPKLRKRRRA